MKKIQAINRIDHNKARVGTYNFRKWPILVKNASI